MKGEIISLETAKKLQDYEDRINKAIAIFESNNQNCCIIYKLLKNEELTIDEELELEDILKGDSNDREEERNN